MKAFHRFLSDVWNVTIHHFVSRDFQFWELQLRVMTHAELFQAAHCVRHEGDVLDAHGLGVSVC